MAVSKRTGPRRRPWAHDYYETLPNGSRRRRVQFFRTRAEAVAAEQAWMRHRPHGRPSIDPGSTVADVARQWLATLRASVRPNSYESNRCNVERHLLPRFGKWMMRDWTRGTLKAFLAEKLQEPVVRAFTSNAKPKLLRDRRSPQTVSRILGTASALASFAVDAELLPANPFLRLGKTLQLTTTKKARQNRAKKKR